jgi:hypothetical protein
MARIFMTGFEDGSLGAFSSVGAQTIVSTAQKRTGAYSMLLGTPGADSQFGEATLAANVTELYVRFGLYLTGTVVLDMTYPPLIQFKDYLGANQILVGLIAASLLPMLSSTSPTMNNIAIGTIPIPLNSWCCVEVYIKIADAPNGRVMIKIDGAISLDFTGDTLNANVAGIRLVHFGRVYHNYWNGVTGYVDDISINDTTGAVNTGWIGQGGIRLAFVNGNSAAHAPDMTPSAGANWQCVDEIPASDADYVSDATVDAYDLYTLDTSSMPAAGSVSAVKWISRAKLDTGGANITPVIRSGGTTQQQTDIALSTNYAVKSLIMDVDPIDSAAWTIAKINALEIGAAVG